MGWFRASDIMNNKYKPEQEIVGLEIDRGRRSPNLKLTCWAGECYIRVTAPMGRATMIEEHDKVKWRNSKREVHLYPSERRIYQGKDGKGVEHEIIQNEHGGTEFEVVLKERPPSNVLTFDIETQGLEFYYQPELTQKEIDAGAFRPENVVGSYAVYHATRTNMHRTKEDAEKYKTGKAFHIYRPKVVDASGNETWGELNIDARKGIMTITINKEWLDGAVYPITVDPTFGYETIGGTSWGLMFDNILGSKFTCTESGTADSITCYFLILMSGTLQCAIYDSSLVLVGGTEQKTVDSDGWYTFNFSAPKPSLSAADYWLVAGGTDAYEWIQYDAGAANQWMYSSGPVPPWPDTLTPIHYYAYKQSIYCTYTAAAEGGHPTQLRTRRVPGMNLIGGF